MKLIYCQILIFFFPLVLSHFLYSTSQRCGLNGINQIECEQRGCSWSFEEKSCFTIDQNKVGYTLSKMIETPTGYEGYINLIKPGPSIYGDDIESLKLIVSFESEDIFRIKISDANKERWEIPESIISRYHNDAKLNIKNYEFIYTESPFTFEIIRKSDEESLFKLNDRLIFEDQYIEFQTSYNLKAKTFGLGESTRLNHALKTGKTYTLWAEDLASKFMDKNLYSSFPFYLQMINGNAHGVMLFNSNGMDVVLEDESVTFKTIGGVIDLYVFNGPSPDDVVSQYTKIVGRPAMMPYWSLGFHNCKYGYTSVSQVEEVVANYSAAGIPLDTQWMDIDYMDEYRDFTLDPINFPQSEVSKFVEKLHNNGQHFVTIIDPGIMVYKGYDAYEEGIAEGLFMKDLEGNYYLSQVWPGPTHFPDFLHPKTQSYWTKQVKKFHDSANIDGLWIDMNEVSNFCNNLGKSQVCKNSSPLGCPISGRSNTKCCLVCEDADPENSLDFPPYHIRSSLGRIGTKTMSPSAKHFNNFTSYNTHNLYGLTEQIATNQALVDVRGKRPFVLTRSSFLSTGVHSAKWTGDIGASWEDLKASIISILDLNIFGIPMVGADICGFIDETNEELCARWIEIGAFYPFSRDHNDLGNAPQELYLWDSVTEASKKALGMKYQLLPYFYSLLFNSHKTGSIMIKALWANFPNDPVTIDIQEQFMVGPAIMISPVLDEGKTSVNAYFPKGLWYDFASRAFSVDSSTQAIWKNLFTPLTSVNVHVRGGYILPLQEARMTTTESRKTPFTLLTALCQGGKASGELFWDDGEQVELQAFLTVSYHSEYVDGQGSFVAKVSNTHFDTNLKVQNLVIMGPNLLSPQNAFLNDSPIDHSLISYDESKRVLSFSSLNINLSESFELKWH